MLSRQFNPPEGNDKDKEKLIHQLSKSFPDKAMDWISHSDIKVEKTHISPSEIDWDNRHTWAATHEPEKVAKKRKQIEHGKDKPVVVVERPHHDNLFIMDGHHHAEAYTELDKKSMPAYVIKVPRVKGEWDTFHSKQEKSSPEA